MPSQTHPFRVKARLFRILGDELIRDASLAVFELVKNAYDADATSCDVTLRNPEDVTKAEIVVRDNGCGMTAEIVRDVWLVIATDFRAEQREERKRTEQFHRYPLGEKGLGRLAVHKLGRHITLITRSTGCPEVAVELDWEQLERVEDMSRIAITVTTREPEVFKGRAHGTCIEVRRLRETWDRAKARNLQRAVTSLCSPFHGPDDFKVKLSLVPHTDWLEGLLNPREVRKMALYHAEGWLEGKRLVYDYEFRPLPQMEANLQKREKRAAEHTLTLKRDRKVEEIDLSANKIGRVRFEFNIFDLETDVLRLALDDVKGFKDYLRENGGIRIYRDGVRVFDFGEPGNDWLNLDGRRVNEPVGKISNRQILGVVLLDGETSGSLREKSNREGFIDNTAYQALKDALLCALVQIEADRRKDQKQVRLFYLRRGAARPVMEEIADLREALQERGLLSEMEPKLKTIEQQFHAFQDTMLRAAAPGLTFGTVIHEAEKLVKELVVVVKEEGDIQRMRVLVQQLAKLMDGLGGLLRRTGPTREKASALIDQAYFNCEFRFRAHNITFTNGIKLGNQDFTVTCTRRLIVATLMNFIDNSIYWLQAAGRTERHIYMGTSLDLEGGPCIVTADNGPGFQDEPDELVQPFFSRRSDGMGLGLYLADEIAKRHKGRLLFLQRGDLALPKKFTGAIVAFQFPKEK